jgi:hypothetical protein
MRWKMRWTTTRWLWPHTLRQERIGQLYGSTKYKDLFDQKFLEGLEKRRDLLESRTYKLWGLQTPLFLLLAFSLVNLDVKLSLAGFSIEGVRGIREIILVILGFLTMASSNIQRELDDVKEVMSGIVAKMSGDKIDVLDLLKVRFGLGGLTGPGGYDPKLLTGGFHLALAILAILPALLFIGASAALALGIELITVWQIWLHPNFSRAVSVAVIAFVLVTYIALIILTWLKQGLQPFQTFEDIEKLSKMQWKDKARYDEIIGEIRQQQEKRGFFSKLLFRPHLPRINSS